MSYFFLVIPQQPSSTLFPYTTLFRSGPGESGSPRRAWRHAARFAPLAATAARSADPRRRRRGSALRAARSEEHTSELQSHVNLVCRLLLEKKKKKVNYIYLMLMILRG